LRTEEAGVLGCAGPHAPGDIMLLPAAGYGDITHTMAHAPGLIEKPDPRYGVWGGSEGTHQHLPSVDHSEGTIMPAFIMAGPGVKAGVRREKPIYLRDIAPTLAHLVGIPCPANADGRVLTDLLN
jgi:arylsulfatase A-like enzyme